MFGLVEEPDSGQRGMVATYAAEKIHQHGTTLLGQAHDCCQQVDLGLTVPNQIDDAEHERTRTSLTFFMKDEQAMQIWSEQELVQEARMLFVTPLQKFSTSLYPVRW